MITIMKSIRSMADKSLPFMVLLGSLPQRTHAMDRRIVKNFLDDHIDRVGRASMNCAGPHHNLDRPLTGEEYKTELEWLTDSLAALTTKLKSLHTSGDGKFEHHRTYTLSKLQEVLAKLPADLINYFIKVEIQRIQNIYVCREHREQVPEPETNESDIRSIQRMMRAKNVCQKMRSMNRALKLYQSFKKSRHQRMILHKQMISEAIQIWTAGEDLDSSDDSDSSKSHPEPAPRLKMICEESIVTASVEDTKDLTRLAAFMMMFDFGTQDGDSNRIIFSRRVFVEHVTEFHDEILMSPVREPDASITVKELNMLKKYGESLLDVCKKLGGKIISLENQATMVKRTLELLSNVSIKVDDVDQKERSPTPPGFRQRSGTC